MSSTAYGVEHLAIYGQPPARAVTGDSSSTAPAEQLF